MPTDEITIKGLIEHLERILEKSDKEEPTTTLWRRSSTSLEDDRVHYAEWNLPGIPKDIVEREVKK